MIRRMIYTLLSLAVILLVWQGYELWVATGRLPRGKRLERCKQSPQWKGDQFVNTHHTPVLTSHDGFIRQMYRFLSDRITDLRPDHAVPTVKTSLKDIPRSREICVWLGHSTVYIQTQGIRLLFDPVLTDRLPVSLLMRPFQGSDVYTTDDIPDVDCLVITHDHWDHLDWKTVTALKDRVGQVVCALGIGEHFEYWGYDPQRIHDLDWGENFDIHPSTTHSGHTLRLHCLPSRHFSGRTGRHKTLWASYMIDGTRRIFISGDGGYDERFQQFGRQFPDIDLAILENGQYNSDWQYIHTLPDQLPTIIEELGARRVITYHNSKYALARHPWTEPLDSIYQKSRRQGTAWQLLTPRIGEPVRLDDPRQSFDRWW